MLDAPWMGCTKTGSKHASQEKARLRCLRLQPHWASATAAWVQLLSCIISAERVSPACEHSLWSVWTAVFIEGWNWVRANIFSCICSGQAAETSNQLPWLTWCLVTQGWWWNITRPSLKNMPPMPLYFTGNNHHNNVWRLTKQVP